MAEHDTDALLHMLYLIKCKESHEQTQYYAFSLLATKNTKGNSNFLIFLMHENRSPLQTITRKSK